MVYNQTDVFSSGTITIFHLHTMEEKFRYNC